MFQLQNISVSRRLGALVTLATMLIVAIALGTSYAERNTLTQERQSAVRQTVEIAYGLLQHYYDFGQKNGLSQEQAQQLALQAIAKLRYSGNEYFWVNDMHPRMVMHAVRPQLDGQDVSNHRDPAGRQLFVDFVNIVKQDGKGYHSYLWPKPGSEDPVEKVSYVMGFQPWGWIIGSGVYIDTVHAAFASRVKWIAGITVLMAAWLLVTGIWIARSVTRQLGAEPAHLLAMTEKMAQGDMATALTHDDGRHSVLHGMERMRSSIAHIVLGVRRSAEHVALASQEISQGNHDLSIRTEQQASALEETATSMEQFGSSIRQNADSARHANQMAVNASQVAEQGGHVVEEVVNTMRGIHEASQRIADIIGVIDGIAFQTNILALNAAVEAARAGEQGRGFAVVASEVRSLAQRSAEAAKEIKSLITTSVERVTQGTALADRAGTTMAEVVAAIGQVNHIVGEISAASAEQSAGVTQVTEAITQMDQNTQQNAALVEQSASAARSLQALAENLVKAVAAFQLDVGHSTRQPALAPAKLNTAQAALPRRSPPQAHTAMQKEIPQLEKQS